MPYWREEKLKHKIQKRMQEDRKCEIIYPNNENEDVISVDNYKRISKNAVKDPYIEVEYYHRKSESNRKAFADEKILVSITEEEGNRFETCFHLHFSVRECERIMKMTKEDRKRIFEKWIDRKVRIGEKSNVKWIKRGDA